MGSNYRPPPKSTTGARGLCHQYGHKPNRSSTRPWGSCGTWKYATTYWNGFKQILAPELEQDAGLVSRFLRRRTAIIAGGPALHIVHVRQMGRFLPFHGQTWVPRVCLLLLQSSHNTPITTPTNITFHVDVATLIDLFQPPSNYPATFNLDLEEVRRVIVQWI